MQAHHTSPSIQVAHDASAHAENARVHGVTAPTAQAVPRGERHPTRRQRSWRQASETAVDKSRWTSLQLRQVGDFRIYAGVLGAPEGGYIAAVEVHRVGLAGQATEAVFRSEGISGRHRFDVAALALRHALDIGHQAVRLHLSPDA